MDMDVSMNELVTLNAFCNFVTMQKGFQSILFGDIGTRGMFAFMVR